FWVADCIAAHPDVKLIYSDEDKADEGGHRFGPYFKSDWNVDLFRSQNMFSHLGVLSTELMRSVGGFRVGMEGSQDWDLVLRCMERIEPG
ncbi:glycosyltransferase family 2 protein, partial [Mycobacterium tuberculosis]